MTEVNYPSAKAIGIASVLLFSSQRKETNDDTARIAAPPSVLEMRDRIIKKINFRTGFD